MPREHLVQPRVDTVTLQDPIFKGAKKGFLWDDEAPGLALVIHPTKKSWLWQFDRWVDGKRVQLTKVKPDFSKLKDARDWAKDQTALARRGVLDKKPEPPKVAPAGPEAWTVKEALDKRLAYMKTEGGYADSTIKGFEKHVISYLLPIHNVKMGELTRDDCKKVHATITATGKGKKHKDGTPRGAASWADTSIAYLGATWNHAKDHDNANRMPVRDENPTKAVKLNPKNKVQDSITSVELPQWAAVVATLTPVKRNMHMIGLFTGFRWTTLQTIEKAWRQGDLLVIPPEHIKSRRGFTVPLSTQLVKLFDEAMKAAAFIDPSSKYLFPSPTAKEGYMATDDERKLKKANERWDGKLRRKTYYTQAGRARVPDKVRSALMDHAVPGGLRGNYEHQEEMMDDLRKWQQIISDRLEQLCNAKTA